MIVNTQWWCVVGRGEEHSHHRMLRSQLGLYSLFRGHLIALVKI